MRRVVICAVNGESSHAAVDAAVGFCREHGAELVFVGVVEDKLSDATRAGAGERVRRFQLLQLELVRALKRARSARVDATATVRAGDRMGELLSEANDVGASELFFARTRSGIRAALGREPRTVVVHKSLGVPAEEELANAA
jgi:nucleotide-binding universal stress UspA family protein